MTMRDPIEVIAAIVAEMNDRAKMPPHHDCAEAHMRKWAYRLECISTPQPAAADVDDRCVRHACKRQAMERDAEIARLRKLLAEARDVAGIDAFTIPVKGDSHAG